MTKAETPTASPLAAIFSEISGELSKVDKRQAILSHLHCAFQLHSIQAGDISVHLLAMAAHEMLTSIAHAKRIEMTYPLKGLRVIETADDRREAKFVYNFFKHARNDHHESIEYSVRNLRILNELTLASAAANYQVVFEQTDAAIDRFLAYHALRFRSALTQEALDAISELEAEKAISEEERIYLLRSGLRRALAWD